MASISDEQIARMLQAVRGLPAGSPELDAAMAAIVENDRWAAALMMGDVTEYAPKLTKRTTLRDDLRHAVHMVRKTKLKAYLTEHPLRDFDHNDDGVLNNLVQLLYEPEYFDRFKGKEEPDTQELRRVREERPPLSPEEEQREILKTMRELAGDPKDWLTPAEIDELLKTKPNRVASTNADSERER